MILINQIMKGIGDNYENFSDVKLGIENGTEVETENGKISLVEAIQQGLVRMEGPNPVEGNDSVYTYTYTHTEGDTMKFTFKTGRII